MTEDTEPLENKVEEEPKHSCNYTFISSCNGDYNVCRECGNVILVFTKNM